MDRRRGSRCKDSWKYLAASECDGLCGSLFRNRLTFETAVDGAPVGEQEGEWVAAIEGALLGAQAQYRFGALVMFPWVMSSLEEQGRCHPG